MSGDFGAVSVLESESESSSLSPELVGHHGAWHGAGAVGPLRLPGNRKGSTSRPAIGHHLTISPAPSAPSGKVSDHAAPGPAALRPQARVSGSFRGKVRLSSRNPGPPAETTCLSGMAQISPEGTGSLSLTSLPFARNKAGFFRTISLGVTCWDLMGRREWTAPGPSFLLKMV